MLKFLKRVWFWLENSRIFSIPMSIFSWLVVFIFALIQGGNWFFGILALIGICCGQLATNLFDDYLDYKVLLKKGTLQNSTKAKCRYITNGEATLEQVFRVVCIYCAIAMLMGAILLYFTGLPVLIFAILGGILVLIYSKMSMVGLSELAVGLAFGPILFGGVYWVMTQTLSAEIFIIGTVVVMFTIGLLYTHTLLDFDGDMESHKKTLCCRIGNKNLAVIGLGVIYALGYGLLFAAVVLKYLPSIFLIAFFTIPLAIELIVSVLMYNYDKNILPEKKFWHFPAENIEKLKEQGTYSFQFRLYQARNLMIDTSLLICVAKIISVYF